MRVGWDDGDLRPWHYVYLYSIESRLIIEIQARFPGVLFQIFVVKTGGGVLGVHPRSSVSQGQGWAISFLARCKSLVSLEVVVHIDLALAQISLGTLEMQGTGVPRP